MVQEAVRFVDWVDTNANGLRRTQASSQLLEHILAPMLKALDPIATKVEIENALSDTGKAYDLLDSLDLFADLGTIRTGDLLLDLVYFCQGIPPFLHKAERFDSRDLYDVKWTRSPAPQMFCERCFRSTVRYEAMFQRDTQFGVAVSENLSTCHRTNQTQSNQFCARHSGGGSDADYQKGRRASKRMRGQYHDLSPQNGVASVSYRLARKINWYRAVPSDAAKEIPARLKELRSNRTSINELVDYLLGPVLIGGLELKVDDSTVRIRVSSDGFLMVTQHDGTHHSPYHIPHPSMLADWRKRFDSVLKRAADLLSARNAGSYIWFPDLGMEFSVTAGSFRSALLQQQFPAVDMRGQEIQLMLESPAWLTDACPPRNRARRGG